VKGKGGLALVIAEKMAKPKSEPEDDDLPDGRASAMGEFREAMDAGDNDAMAKAMASFFSMSRHGGEDD
jgi:hypothetical protein